MAQPNPQSGGDRFGGIETFDPYQNVTLGTGAALYGGAPECPWDPEGNYLCICLT